MSGSAVPMLGTGATRSNLMYDCLACIVDCRGFYKRLN